MTFNNIELLDYLNKNINIHSFTCPHCKTFCNLYSYQYTFDSFEIDKIHCGCTIKVKCPNCNKYSLYYIWYTGEIIEQGFEGNVQYLKITEIEEIKQIYPREKTIAKTFPDYVPKQLITFYEEMCDLYPVNTNATAIWARKWVEKFIIIESSDIEKKDLKDKTLDKKIELFNQNKNTSLDASILTALRRIGNKTIHIFSSDEDIEISHEDAYLIIKNIEYLINYFYIVPHEKKESEDALLALETTVVNKSKELSKQ